MMTVMILIEVGDTEVPDQVLVGEHESLLNGLEEVQMDAKIT